MKRLFFYFAAVALLFTFSASATTVFHQADEVWDLPAPYTYQQVYALPEGARIITDSDIYPTDVEISAYAMDPITPANSNGMKAVLLNVLGNYSAIQVEMRYTNNNGTYSYQREIQPDYVWIASAAIFALMVYCCFRLGGGWLCRR